MNAYEELVKLFDSGGSAEYLGESITMKEHMLQCADLAVRDGASSELIVAALTHDIGHLLVSDALALQESNIDAHHDELGAKWLAERFPESVSEPVRLHVAAKRYLVSTDPNYLGKLSPASVHTFNLQGGKMSDNEIFEFRSHSVYESAIQVRLWDDEGKVVGSKTSDLSTFESTINSVAMLQTGTR